MTTYSFMGQEVPIELIDLLNEYISEYIELGIPKTQYQPFLKGMLQEVAEETGLRNKKKILRRQCQHFLNQWERTVK